MSKALLVTLGAVLRRFGTAAGTAVLAFVVNEWTHWLRDAMDGDPKSAAWIPIVWLVVEFVQKLIRERQKEKEEIYF